MNHTLTPSNKQQKTLDFRIKYKTEKCRYWLEKGYCPYFQSCAFAHFDQQLRQKKHISNNYKTKICINFVNRGFCNYGERCLYRHSAQSVSDKENQGKETRSNSEQSHSSKSSKSEKKLQSCSNQIDHYQRIQLLKDFGIDAGFIGKNRNFSRLLSLLNNSTDNEYSTIQNSLEIFSQALLSEKKDKKYSL